MKQSTLIILGRSLFTPRIKYLATIVSIAGLVFILSLSGAGSVAALLLPPLDVRFEAADLCQRRAVTGIVVLGGGDQRLVEAGNLARWLANAKIVITGAGPEPHIRDLLGPGIDPSRITIEPNARTTYENATFTAALVSRSPGERWLLLTSATHMPRAMGAFYHAGFQVEPWPVHDLATNSPDAPTVAWHEWLGLAEYWFFGKSSALFPGRTLIAKHSDGEISPPDACRDASMMASGQNG